MGCCEDNPLGRGGGGGGGGRRTTDRHHSESAVDDSGSYRSVDGTLHPSLHEDTGGVVEDLVRGEVDKGTFSLGVCAPVITISCVKLQRLYLKMSK